MSVVEIDRLNLQKLNMVLPLNPFIHEKRQSLVVLILAKTTDNFKFQTDNSDNHNQRWRRRYSNFALLE